MIETMILFLSLFFEIEFSMKIQMYCYGSREYICVGDENNDGQMNIIIGDCLNGFVNIYFGYVNESIVPMKNESTGRD